MTKTLMIVLKVIKKPIPLTIFLLPGSVCAIAVDNKSTNTVWFVQIIGEFDYSENVIDDYGHTVSAGKEYILGHFLKQVHDQITRKKI